MVSPYSIGAFLGLPGYFNGYLTRSNIPKFFQGLNIETCDWS